MQINQKLNWKLKLHSRKKTASLQTFRISLNLKKVNHSVEKQTSSSSTIFNSKQRMKPLPSIKISKQKNLQSRLAKTSNNTAFQNSIKIAPLVFKTPTLKKTMKFQKHLAVRATLFSVTSVAKVTIKLNLFRLCLK